MFAEQEGGARLAKLQPALEQAIEHQIVQRTCGRVQALEVEVTDNRVVVRGRAPSYYVEQLALQGVLDVIESVGGMRIALNIQVGSPPKSAREAL
jgi:reactive chlorine resistance protein C